jgi:TATA-box binding protein (TBP) (component of TFIID and TFIIIB)
MSMRKRLANVLNILARSAVPGKHSQTASAIARYWPEKFPTLVLQYERNDLYIVIYTLG